MRRTFLIPLALFLTACQPTPQRDIGRPDRPIADSPEQQADDSALANTLTQPTGPAPGIAAGRAYTLAQLIDIAQQRNPATRQAWLNARIAGRAEGVAESALLPIISASVIAGRTRFDNDLNLPIGGAVPVRNSASGTAAVLSATWLLFDFGENAARRAAADQLARVAELGFNRVHQQLVFDTASAYHTRLAALQKERSASAAGTRADQLLNAAQRRLSAGVGTEVEVAQARQLRAQTRLVAQVASGEANAAAVALASALAVPPSTRIRLSAPDRALPAPDDRKMTALIESGFARRPDVLAALAQVRVAQSDMDAVAASYLPKVFAGGSAALGRGSADLNGLYPGGIGPTTSSGVFVGVTVPIYDGRLRETRTRNARDRLAAAQNGVGVARSLASREIALAYEALRTALAVHGAAGELVRAARTTARAADKAYENGLGTIGEAGIAALGLYTAEETLADARRDAHAAALTLALATGR